MSAGAVFAWLTYYQNTIVIYSGDVKITVVGSYDIYTIGQTPSYDTQLTSANVFNDLEADEMIAYKFVITNQTNYPAVLSLAFSNFCNSMFDQFDAFRNYYNSYNTANGTFPAQANYSTTLVTDITNLAIENTAKLTLLIQDAYYTSSTGSGTVTIPDADRYLWKYATGERYFENIPLAANETISLYFTLNNMQSSAFIRSYEEWLCGDGTTPSYAQEYLANYLGYTYAALPSAEATIINDYIGYFFDKELQAANPGEADSSILKLDIDYMEFIAESTVAPNP